jgi:hypothetical protein
MSVLSLDECAVCTVVAKLAPVDYEPLLARRPFHAFERATPADWAKLVQEMSDVQQLVHLTGRMTVFDNQELGNRLFAEARETYRQTLSREAMRLGCKGSTVPLAAGPELSALRGRADWAAGSVGGTYNLNLAKEIFRIYDETPTANRHVYAHRLYYAPNAWDKRYWADKSTEISQVETMTSVNAATADFYARNGDIAEATTGRLRKCTDSLSCLCMLAVPIFAVRHRRES